MPYDSTDYVTKSATFTDLKSEFAPLPTVSQSTSSNQSWVVVTTSVSHPDGSTSQTTAIAAKPR